MMDLARRLLRRKFIRDTLILQAGRIVNAGLSLIAFTITVRLLGFEGYGVWKLVVALFAIGQSLDVTGTGLSTANRLAIAVGARDDAGVLDQMAFYVKVTLVWSAITAVLMFAVGPLAAARLYDSNRAIGDLAAWFSLTLAADALYTLVIISLRSRRLMREYAVLQNVNQVVLFVCVVTTMLIRPAPDSLVVARLVYSYSTMLLAFAVYARLRHAANLDFPSIRAVAQRVRSVPIRPYWRSGVAMAMDKNMASLYTQVPITLVGMIGGSAAAGYLGTGLDLISRSNLITGPILENVQAVVPQAVGKGDFLRLSRNLGRVVLVMGAAGTAVYGALALVAPIVVPLLFGERARDVVPVVMVLALYGVVAGIGGVLGPVYRALALMRLALTIKVLTAIIMLPVGLALIQQLGATGGAWMIAGLFLLSASLTAAFTLRPLFERARLVKQEA